MAKNPYMVLGVSETASDEEIRAAYRRLAKQYHPDLNPNDPAAAAKMNDVNVAYDQIKTAEKRAAYRESEKAQTYYQQTGYQYNPWGSYYQTGHGYYGGSYTGNEHNDGNEPPFGWSSIFEEQRRRTVNTSLYRSIRIVYLVLAFLLISLFASCVFNGLFYTCVYPLSGACVSADDAQTCNPADSNTIGDLYEIS